MRCEHSTETDSTWSAGEGASKEGARPFIDVLPVADPSTAKRVWQSEAPYYEVPVATVLNEQDTAPLVSLDNLSTLISRETTQEPPQIFVASFSEVRAAPSWCTMVLPCRTLLYTSYISGLPAQQERNAVSRRLKRGGVQPVLSKVRGAGRQQA